MLLMASGGRPHFLGDLAILFEDVAVCGLVAIQPAEQFRGHAPVGTLRPVLIDDVEKGELAFGIGSRFFRHGRLVLDMRAAVKEKDRLSTTVIVARDINRLSNRHTMVDDGGAAARMLLEENERSPAGNNMPQIPGFAILIADARSVPETIDVTLFHSVTRGSARARSGLSL